MKWIFCVFFMLIAVFSVAASPAFAQYSWLWQTGNSRDFTLPGNWDPYWYGDVAALRIDDNSVATSPVLNTYSYSPANSLYIGSTYSTVSGGFLTPTTNGGMLTIETGGNLTVLGRVNIGTGGPVTGDSLLKMTGGILTTSGSGGSNEFIVGCDNSSGTLELSGDAKIVHDYDNNFHIGVLANGHGLMTMSGTSSLVMDSSGVYNTGIWIGYAGTLSNCTGALEMTESSTVIADSINLGYNSDGSIAMTGSSSILDQRPKIENYGETVVGQVGGISTVQITDALYTNTGDFIVGKTGASGALTLTTSTESVNPATLTVGGKLAVGVDSGSGTFVLNGGSSVTVTGSIVLGGRSDGSPAAATASGIVDIYGGTVTKENTPGTYMFLGSAGTGEWNQHGGATIIHAPTIFGDDGSITGTLNLNGGVYATSRIYTGVAGVGTAQGRINFDGGTLQADPTGFQFSSGNPFIFLRNAPDLVISVKQHGATIDTNGADITIPVGFTKDTASSGGGLTKIGGGVMALTGKSTYDGLTVIKEGTLQTRITFQTVYTAPNYPGNRTDGPFALGHDFTVNSPVQVTQLGVFDDLGDGILGTHAVHLTNLDDPLFDQIVTFDATTNETTTYSRGFRFATLGTPLSLAAGHYLLWVDSLGGDNDAFAQDICEFDSGNTGAIAMGTSWYDLTPGTMPQQPWGANDATVSFVFYDPASVTNAAILPSMTPVQLGGAVGSTPTLDLQGANQQIGSLADVAGAAVMGVVTNSLPIQPVVLTLAADSGTTTYSGSIEGNLSLVKTGGSTQILTGSLTYTGDTTVNEGTLIVNDLVMPGSTISVKDGATLEARSIVADTLSIGGAPSSGAASPIAVPEPCTLVLLTLAIAAMATCMARGRK